MMDEGFGISPEMLAKAAVYLSVLVAAGACAVRWLIAPRLDRGASPLDLIHSASRVLFVAAVLAAAGVLLRAWTHTIAAFGFADSIVWDNFRLIVVESRWGQGFFWQALASGALLVTSAAVRAGLATAWPFASASALAFIVSLPFVGHAAGDPVRMSMHGAHVLGASLWIGSLIVLLADLRRRRSGTLAFQLFAPVAIGGTLTIVLSGLIASALYIRSIDALFGTAYGRTLLIKIGLFAATAAYGYFNWREMQRVSAGGTTVPVSTMMRTVGREVALGVAVILVTGVLTELPNP